MEACYLAAVLCLMSTICMLSGIFTLYFGAAVAAALMGSDSLVPQAIGDSANVWISIGAITIAISIFGFFSVCNTSRETLAAYGLILLLLSASEMYIGVSLTSSLESVTRGTSSEATFKLMMSVCYGTAAFELIGAVIGLYAAKEYDPEMIKAVYDDILGGQSEEC